MKKHKKTGLTAVCAAVILLCGCGGGDAVYLESAQTGETGTENVSREAAAEAVSGAEQTVFVYVCGAVENPGVYELPEGSRVYEAVELAGGMTDEASPDSLNLAECVADGQMLRIPTEEEAILEKEETSAAEADDGLLDINEADASGFMTLPGIGEAKADAIVRYREEHGDFSSIEELMNVEGIKEGIFNKIKDSIKI